MNLMGYLLPSDLVNTLRRLEVDFILLAGYLILIPVELIRAYQRSIFNIHPSLLPAFGGKGFYGMKVHKAVIASGASVLFPCLLMIPLRSWLQGFSEEQRLYVEVVKALCEEHVVWREDGVPLIRSKENPNDFS
ncbi:hypothetical protein TanjilG_23708 [Lupinus angustifolius]|uniref:phosphoribosylglycinamide formyltransferase 1 n=1 Tax=Lupinus angustifolius TaxID=3871 RepID=A0A1J7FN33_LUPAN|nr:hypothetical protein TanjilG_23708 [Lupinus angustifolius]